MKLMNIILYLTLIAFLKGALCGYIWWTTSYTAPISHQVIVCEQGAGEPNKESTSGLIEIFVAIMQVLWAFLVGIVQRMWHGVREWIELVLMLFECTELAHKLAERFNFWGVPH